MPTIGTTNRGAYAVTTFRKIQTVTGGAAYPVVLHPTHMRLINSALKHQIFDQPSDRVIGQRRDDCGVESEAPLQSARDVVFSAAFPYLKRARRMNVSRSGIETQHHLAEAYLVPAAI